MLKIKRLISIAACAMCVAALIGCSSSQEAAGLEEIAQESGATDDGYDEVKEAAGNAEYAISNEYVDVPVYCGVEIDDVDIASEDDEADIEDRIRMSAWEKVIDGSELKTWDEQEYQKLLDSYMSWYKEAAEEEDLSLEDFAKEIGYKDVDGLEEDMSESAKDDIKERYVARAIADAEGLDVDNADESLNRIARDYGYDSVEEFQDDLSDEELEEEVYFDLASNYVADHCIVLSGGSDDTPDDVDAAG